jgi:Zn-dependent protease with chaperone function
MGPNTTPLLPPRRSLAAWAALAAVLIVGFYILTLALATACVYFPYLLLTAQNGAGLQVLLLFLSGVVIAGTILWSLIPRREKFIPPGPRLEASRHPRLFAEIERLAARFKEPAPQEVYLIPEVNAWVAQRGGRESRIMGLGLPLLQILTVSRFRAVLAHEFAHYYGGDTRLGPWVYKTRLAMVRTLKGLGQPSAVLNVVTRFALARLAYVIVTRVLIAYWNLFLRITQLISRRQEYRADELACAVAGSGALTEGLQDIHRAAVAVSAYWGELGQVLGAGYRPPIAEGFKRFMAAEGIREAVGAQLEKELAHPHPQPLDSHPPLRDRLAAAGRLPAGNEPDDDHPAISLLEDLTSLEAQLLEKLNPKQNVGNLKLTQWEEVSHTIYVPGWRKYMAEYAELLAGVTAGSLPEKVKELAEMGARIRDPKGMLLTREQRTRRAADLLAAALCLALLDSGWELHAQPGEFHLERGTEHLQPFRLVRDLAANKLTAEAWLGRIQALGIEDLSLDPNQPPPALNGMTL